MLYSGRRYVFDFLLKKILFPSTANRDQEIESRDQDFSQSEFVDFRQHTKTDRKSCISFVEAFLLSKVKLLFFLSKVKIVLTAKNARRLLQVKNKQETQLT